jgi:hypothetical protein
LNSKILDLENEINNFSKIGNNSWRITYITL